jgi:hypothetical protein
MGIFPPERAIPDLRQLCVGPCITAHTQAGVSDYAIASSVLALYNKLELLLDQLAMPSASDEKLDFRSQVSLKCVNIFPVLALLALADMPRLQRHTPIDLITVPRINDRFRDGDACINQLLDHATLVTWAM